MRYVEKLLTQIRRESENEDATATTGISDDEILQYINDAQDRLQSVIETSNPLVFTEEVIIPSIGDQEAYDIPEDAYIFNKIVDVEYSASASTDEFYHLTPRTMKRRDSSISGLPSEYVRRQGQILLQPKPQSAGEIRLTYVKRIDNIDKRRGVLSVAATSGDTITALEIDPSGNPSLDFDTLSDEDFLCVISKLGKINMRNIPISSIDQTTGVVTLEAGFTFDSDESINVGDFVVGGKDTTTHSTLSRMSERYLIAYAVWKLFKRDSSVDSQEQEAELSAMETDIVNSYKVVSQDTSLIPVLNDWIEWE
jgi:hypothetical protein